MFPPAPNGSSTSTFIPMSDESCTAADHMANLGHNSPNTCPESKDATEQLAAAEGHQNSEPDTEDRASSNSDDQWEVLFHLLPLEEDGSETEPHATRDVENSSLPASWKSLTNEYESGSLEKIGAVTMQEQHGLVKDNDTPRVPTSPTNLDEPVSRPATENISTCNEVGASDDEESCAYSVHTDTGGPIGTVNTADHKDWGCICVSVEVARIATEAREQILEDLTKVLGFIVDGETDFPYRQESNPWMVKSFDERLGKAFQHIVDDLQCLDEATTKPKHGHRHTHINNRISDIIKAHIDNIGLSLVAEVEAMILVNDFLSDMVQHELRTTAWPPRGTTAETIAALNRESRQHGGLNPRLFHSLSYLQSMAPRQKMSLPKRDVGPGLRIEGLYSQFSVEHPLGRWGGLDSRLDIHESDAVMDALARSVYGIAVCGAYLGNGPAVRATFGEVRLSDMEARSRLGVWFGEREAAMYFSTDVEFHIATYHAHGPPSNKLVEHSPPPHIATERFTIKHIRHKPDAHSPLVIETNHQDFYRLYQRYRGTIHPEEVSGHDIPGVHHVAWDIRLVCAGTVSVDIGLADFEAMMEVYHCERHQDRFTQRRWPERGLRSCGDAEGSSAEGEGME